MGCWGITAFESDAGLDAVGFIRNHLPENGKLELGKIIKALRQDSGMHHPIPSGLIRIPAQWHWQKSWSGFLTEM